MANVVTDAETGLITREDMKRVREVDFIRQFEHNSLRTLIEVLGITRVIPVMEGTQLYVYKTSGTLANGNVPEGEIIPLSEYTVTKDPIGEASIKKYRKAVSLEGALKSGFDTSVKGTDAELLSDVYKDIRKGFFDLINGPITGAATATGVDLQHALANGWGQLQVKYEDDAIEPVYFVNPLDIADYLGAAQITTQNTFGMNYVQNFLGLGTVISSHRITKGTFGATAKKNIVMPYVSVSGNKAMSELGLAASELGYVGINSGDPVRDRAQFESVVVHGVTLMIEYAEGVVKGTITGA